MQLFNDKKLAMRLRAGEVSSKECLYYFLLLSMFTALSSLIPFSYDDYVLGDYLGDVAYVLFVFFGTLWLYSINAKGDNKAFIERYICLSVPVTMRVFLLALVLMLLFFGFFTYVVPMPSVLTLGGFSTLIFMCLFMSYFYLNMHQSMKIAAQG